MSFSQFECLSKEILHQIAEILGSDTFLGPPTDVCSLRLLSTTVFHRISWHSVFAKVFREKFDVLAPVRRLGRVCEHPDVLTEELAIRFETLKRFRTAYYFQNGHIYIGVGAAETLRRDLWKAFLMFTESDGKNARQLIEYARIDVFAQRYVSEEGPLLRTAPANRGWIVDNECNSLAVILFSYTDIGRVPCETHDELMAVVKALCQPFADTSGYDFPLEAITVATNPLTTTLRNSSHPNVLSRPSHLRNRTCVIPKHFGFELKLARPRIAESASVCISSRVDRRVREKLDQAMSRRLYGGRHTLPGLGDFYARTHEFRGTELVAWDGVRSAPGSRRFDHDWARVCNLYYPPQVAIRSRVFTPGMLHGNWTGYIFHAEFKYAAPEWPTEEIGLYPTPMEFELREYHQLDKGDVFPFNDVNYGQNGVEGVLNAWFPLGTSLTRISDKLELSEGPEGISCLYEAYNPTAASLDDDLSEDLDAPYGDGVWDIIIMGKVKGSSDDSYQYFGRIRSWDGLVVLVYGDLPVDIEAKRMFYGYLRGYNNLVGRWRNCATSLAQDGLSGAWTMTRRS